MKSKFSKNGLIREENFEVFKSVTAEEDLSSAQKKLIKRRNSTNFVAFLTVRSAESSTSSKRVKIVL